MIKDAFDKIREEIDEIVIDATRHLAKEGLKAVVDNSPVRTGAYVGSHRVSIDGAGVKKPIKPKPKGTAPLANSALAKGSALSTERLKLSGVRLFSTVTILNQAEHAAIVEYIGWDQTPAYGVYMRAESYLKALGTLEF